MLRKKYLTWTRCEHKAFWELSRLDDFTIKGIANLVHERLKIREAYLEPIQTSKMNLFLKTVNS